MIIILEEQVADIELTEQAAIIIETYDFDLPNGITASEYTGKGVILVGLGAGLFAAFPPGADGEYLVYDSSEALGVRSEIPSLTVNDTTNHLINGGFNFAQRQTPATLTTITDGSYGPDRWKMTRENADLQYRRVDASGESGLTSPYYGEFKKITNAGKMLMCQPLEKLDTLKFRGKVIGFQLGMKSNSARTMKIAVVELQAAGVADTLPTLVSAWGADGTDPTLGANLATISTPTSCSVTTSWQTFQFTGTFPSNSKNLLVMVWSNADCAVNDTLGMAEAGLYFGSTLRSWTPRHTSIELQLCRRYYWKTFELETAPAQSVSSSAFRFIAGKAGGTTQYGSFALPAPMRITPTCTTYNISAANSQVRDGTAAADCSGTSVVAEGSTIFINATGNASTAVGNRLHVHITADAEL